MQSLTVTGRLSTSLNRPASEPARTVPRQLSGEAGLRPARPSARPPQPWWQPREERWRPSPSILGI